MNEELYASEVNFGPLSPTGSKFSKKKNFKCSTKTFYFLENRKVDGSKKRHEDG